MPANFFIREGDLEPPLQVTLTGKDGVTPEDLSDAISVAFHFRIETDVGEDPDIGTATILDAVNGVVRYDWVAGDTDIPGNYAGHFIVTTAVGEQTFPSQGAFVFTVTEDL